MFRLDMFPHLITADERFGTVGTREGFFSAVSHVVLAPVASEFQRLLLIAYLAYDDDFHIWVGKVFQVSQTSHPRCLTVVRFGCHVNPSSLQEKCYKNTTEQIQRKLELWSQLSHLTVSDKLSSLKKTVTTKKIDVQIVLFSSC